MKTSTIQIQYDTEKLNLLRQYMEEAGLQTVMEAELQKLYEKYVLAAVREYIESREPEEFVRPESQVFRRTTVPAG